MIDSVYIDIWCDRETVIGASDAHNTQSSTRVQRVLARYLEELCNLIFGRGESFGFHMQSISAIYETCRFVLKY